MAKRKMKNGGKSKKGKGGAAKAQGRPSRPMQMSKASMEFTMGTCAVTNPFCPEAIGAKWPDGSHVKSLTFDVVGERTFLTTNASGLGAIMLFPTYATQMAVASVTGGIATYNATTSMLAPPTASISRWRLTSWGFRITCVTPPMTTTGTLNIRVLSPMTGASLGTVNCTATTSDASYDVPLARLINQDLFIVPMSFGDDARIFRAPDTSVVVGSWVNPGWQVVQLATLDGLASTNVITVQCYYHYEFIAVDGDAIINYATPAAPENRLVQKASTSVLDRVGNFVSGGLEKIDNLMKSKAARYIAAAALTYGSGNPASGQMLLTAGSARDAMNVD